MTKRNGLYGSPSLLPSRSTKQSRNRPMLTKRREGSQDRKIHVGGLICISLALIVIGSQLAIPSTYGSDIKLFAALTISVGLASIGLRGLWTKLDRTDTLLWGNLGLIVMFGLHPYAMVISDTIRLPFHALFSLVPNYLAATQVGFYATLAFNIGYFAVSVWPSRKKDFVSLTYSGAALLGSVNSAAAARRFAWALLVIAVVAYAGFAAMAGQDFLASVLGGARRGANVSSTAYLYFAPQLIGPASLLFLYSDVVRGKRPTAAVVIALIEVLLFLPGGQRLVLLLTLAPLPLAYVMLRRIRVRATTVVAVVLIGLVTIVSLRDLGSENGPTTSESFARSLSNPSLALSELLTGDDTEMVDALAVEMQFVPSQIPHQPLSILTNVLAAPVPSILWSGKPAPMDSILNEKLFGIEKNNASIAYSFVGELFFDSGVFGVVFGLGALGAGSAALYRMKYFAGRPEVILIYAAALPAIVILMRGSLIYTLGRALFTVFPLVAFWWWQRQKDRPSEPNSRYRRLTSASKTSRTTSALKNRSKWL
jgi:oligosaccharide repeat unit polymerase